MKIPVCNLAKARQTQTTSPKTLGAPMTLVRLYPSRYCLWAMLFIHSASGLALFITSLPWWIKLILAVLVLISALREGYRWRLQPVMRVQHYADGWHLVDERHQEKQLILDWHFRSRWLLVLVMKKPQGRSDYYPVFRDSCSYEHYRWLRVVVSYLVESADKQANHYDQR